MRTSWINSAAPFSSRPSLRSFDMWGGASSSVIVRCSWLLVRLSSRPVLLASCLSLGLSSDASVVSACYPFRPIVVSFGSPLVRQGRRGGGGLRLGLGSPRSLLPVACRGGVVGVAGWFLLCVLLFAAVSMASAGGAISIAPVACHWPLSIGSVLFSRVAPSFLLACPRRRSLSAARGVLAIACGLVLCVVPVACFAPSSWGRYGLIVVGCRRRGSWLVVGSSRRRLVSSFVLSPRLACRRAWRFAARRPLVPCDPLLGISPPIRISPRPPCRGAGRDFLFLSALSRCSVSR